MKEGGACAYTTQVYNELAVRRDDMLSQDYLQTFHEYTRNPTISSNHILGLLVFIALFE